MLKQRFGFIKTLVKPLLAVALVVVLVLGNASGALAVTRGGGRIGGGTFRAPARTYTAPSRPYTSPGGGGYYPGGGIGYPFYFPAPLFFVGGGFGGLFTILLFVSIAGFIVRSFRRAQAGDDYGYSTPAVSVARVQVGLLASARELQTDLDRLARTADTGSPEGLTQVLQETTLALLRHPEYWTYGASESSQLRLESAEAQFNRLALAERSKFSEETLSNVNRQIKEAKAKAALTGSEGAGSLAQATQAPGEYIVVTLLVATQGDLKLPEIQSEADLRRALSQVGAVSSDRLMAVEVLWTPQAEGETLSADELIAEYPGLRLV